MKNKVIFVLDNSGSMYEVAGTLQKNFNSLLKELKEKEKKFKQRTEVSLYKFNTYVETVFTDTNIKNVKSMESYNTGGSTALWKAVKTAVNDAQKTSDYKDEETSYLLLILTDGEENASGMSTTEITKLIQTVEKTGRWTVTFQVPPGGKAELKHFGISSDNIREWEFGIEGMNLANRSISKGLDTYYTARASGQMSVRSFYQPDMSNLNTNALNTKLNDLSKQYKIHSVKVETQVRDFVENELGKTYQKGTVYYELTKKETVQPYKDMLIVNKKNKKIYGGAEARSLLSLPDQDMKLGPGYNSEYDLYVQSTSVNRKLPANTKILIKK